MCIPDDSPHSTLADIDEHDDPTLVLPWSFLDVGLMSLLLLAPPVDDSGRSHIGSRNVLLAIMMGAQVVIDG
jgi:hypothetical protein